MKTQLKENLTLDNTEKVIKELFRNWMIENCGTQDANNYAGTHTEEIAIGFAEDYHKEESKALIEKHKSELRQAEAKGYNLGLSHGQQQ